jgi:hypothetical protein
MGQRWVKSGPRCGSWLSIDTDENDGLCTFSGVATLFGKETGEQKTAKDGRERDIGLSLNTKLTESEAAREIVTALVAERQNFWILLGRRGTVMQPPNPCRPIFQSVTPALRFIAR